MRGLVYRLAGWLGLFWLWRMTHRRAVVILTVHGVVGPSDTDRWRPLRARLRPDRLDYCLSVLERRYRFVSLQDAVDMLDGKRPVGACSMVLTFDDGYRNHVTHALPVLRKHGVPAAVFVSTGHVESRKPFWFDRLDYALQHAHVDGRTVSAGLDVLTLRAGTPGQLAESYARLRKASKAMPRDDGAMTRELDDLAETLERESGARLSEIVEDDPWSSVLTVDEISAATDEVCFGSHTVDHCRVNRVSPEVALDQLRRSKDALERWTGRACRFFCYPDGGVSRAASALVKGCGYDAAVTTRRGLNHVGGDLMRLRRMDLPDTGGAAELLGSVSGFADWARGCLDVLRGARDAGRLSKGAQRAAGAGRS